MKNDNAHILFYNLETNSDLFELKLKNKYPLWDIVRFHIWTKVSNNDSHIFYKIHKKTKSLTNLLKAFLSLRTILFNKFDNLFYTCSRIPNNNNEYFDPYFEKIKNHVQGSWICYETIAGKKKYTNKDMIFDCISYFKILFYYFFKIIGFFDNRNSAEISKIVQTCNNYYKKTIISEFEIKMLIIHFNFELLCFKFLLKYLKIKKIFYYGFSKSLVQAAADLNIPAFEFQHGDITNTTVCYIYPSSIKNYISPKILFTYSEIWTNKKNIPYNCVPVGSVNNYSIKLKKVEIDNSIVILSSPYQAEHLIELAKRLSFADSNLIIYFKLHPMEFENFDYYKFRFIEYRKILLIDIKLNFFDVLSLSNDFILIYSTTLYEIIQYRKNAYIYKITNFSQKELCIEDLEVPIFDTPESFLNLRNSCNTNSLTKINLFKPFNEDLFKLAISNDSF